MTKARKYGGQLASSSSTVAPRETGTSRKSTAATAMPMRRLARAGQRVGRRTAKHVGHQPESHRDSGHGDHQRTRMARSRTVRGARRHRERQRRRRRYRRRMTTVRHADPKHLADHDRDEEDPHERQVGQDRVITETGKHDGYGPQRKLPGHVRAAPRATTRTSTLSALTRLFTAHPRRPGPRRRQAERPGQRHGQDRTGQLSHEIGSRRVVVVEGATGGGQQSRLELGGLPGVTGQSSFQGGDDQGVELGPGASVQLGECRPRRCGPRAAPETW